MGFFGLCSYKVNFEIKVTSVDFLHKKKQIIIYKNIEQ